MNTETIIQLRSLNNAFYRQQHASFSQSRHAHWPGWERVLDHAVSDGFAGQEPSTLDVLDVACGNLRFERFARMRHPEVSYAFTCIDDCDELVGDASGCEYRSIDVLDELVSGTPIFERGVYDLAVSFGFMHHIPSEQLRLRFLDELIAVAKPQAVIAISLWRFALDEGLRVKAERTTREALASFASAGPTITAADLEVGDYLVGWNNEPGVYRYCHSFSDAELDRMAQHLASSAQLVDFFAADGRTNAMNAYLVFRRR